jgi:type I restriction enzyme S subunit
MEVREPAGKYLSERLYQQTEVGVFPSMWAVGSLEQYWSVTDCKHVTADFIASGFPLASIAEVQSRFVNLANANHTNDYFFGLLIQGGRKPRPGDLVLSRNATVGEVAQVAEWHPPFAMGQDVCLLRKKAEALSSDFLQSLLRSPIVVRQFADLMVGSTFKRANVQQIRRITVPMPPATEQHAIASALSDADALIESLEQLLAKKRQIKQGAMQELLTGQRRLPGFAEAWVGKKLGDVAPLQRGFDLLNSKLQPGPYPVVTSNGVLNRHANFQVTGPGVVTGRSGTIGVVHFIDENFWPHNTALWVTSFKGNDPKFVCYLFRHVDLARFASGSGVPTLNRNDVHAFSVLVPPTLAEQTAIATTLSDMDAEITALQARLAKARQLKQGMAQALLTGRIRLV